MLRGEVVIPARALGAAGDIARVLGGVGLGGGRASLHLGILWARWTLHLAAIHGLGCLGRICPSHTCRDTARTVCTGGGTHWLVPATTTRVTTYTLASYTMHIVTIPGVIVRVSLCRAALYLLVMMVSWPLLVPTIITTPRVGGILVGRVVIHTPGTIVPHPGHHTLPGHVLPAIRQGLRLQLHREVGVGAVLGVGDDGGGGRGEGRGGGGDNGAGWW